jgi:hypothetical protein
MSDLLRMVSAIGREKFGIPDPIITHIFHLVYMLSSGDIPVKTVFIIFDGIKQP